jgi:uncharacterized protein (TIGR02271 family)
MRRAVEPVTWDDVTKKGARGLTDESDFGEVHEVGQHYVLTQKGVRIKEKFFIPKYLVLGFDGSTLWFNASQDQLHVWKRDSPPEDYNEYSSYKTQHTPSDIETRIPLIEDPLNVTKRESTSDATTRESAVNTMTINTPVTQEELIVERRQASKSSSMTPERPVDSKTDIKVHPSNEEIEVTKEPYVKEEVMMKKKLDTEARAVEDSAKSKKFDASTIKEE